MAKATSLPYVIFALPAAFARTFNVHPATIYRCIEPNGSL
jgi:hypothetical protein